MKKIVGKGSRLISINLPAGVLEEIDRLVERGYFMSRSDVIRTALHAYLMNVKEEKRGE